MTAHKTKRVVDKAKNNRIRQERANLENFLNILVATDSMEDKVSMITNANPYHFILFKQPTRKDNYVRTNNGIGFGSITIHNMDTV